MVAALRRTTLRSCAVAAPRLAQVINMEDTLAVSYNFVDEASFEGHLQSQCA